MTNEEIVLSGNNELLPLLWENTYKLFYLKAAEYYNRYKERFIVAGATLDDMKQVCYFAMLNAVKAYRKQEISPRYPFISFIDYHIKNAGAKLIGIRTAKDKNEPLNAALSLNETIQGADGRAETERVELIEDETAQQPYNDIIEEAEQMTIRAAALSHLENDTKCRETIKALYFDGLTSKQTAERLAVTPQRISELKQKAIKKLKSNIILQEIAISNGYYKHIGYNNFTRNGSIEEQVIEHKEYLKELLTKSDNLKVGG